MSRQRLLLALASGPLLALAFAPFNLHELAWVALLPLLLASLGASPGAAFLAGFIAGTVFHGITLSWIASVMHVYGNLPRFEAVGVLALLVAARSCFTGAFTLGVALMDRQGRGGALLTAPFLWVALELLLAHLPDINFIWNLLGYSVSARLGLVQLAAWTGIYGLSFVVAGFNALLAWQVDTRTRTAGVVSGLAGVAVLAATLVGPSLLPASPASHHARMVQTNFPQAESYPPDWMDRHAGELRELEQISVGPRGSAPEWVIWPEVPAPFSLEDPKFAAYAAQLARDARSEFLVGEVEWRPGPHGGLAPYNSAAMLDPEGRTVFLYDKMKLVPFGEYVPWRGVLRFARPLTEAVGEFQTGSSYRVGAVSGGTFSVFICYEAIFPEQVRRFVDRGAQVLVNISNDGWFGRSAAPAQHLAMARVRAVENRRWLLRDTNNGFTVSVDPYGRVAARLPSDVRGVLEAPYDFRSDRSLYSRWGDWWADLSAVIAVAGLLRRGQGKRMERA